MVSVSVTCSTTSLRLPSVIPDFRDLKRAYSSSLNRFPGGVLINPYLLCQVRAIRFEQVYGCVGNGKQCSQNGPDSNYENKLD